MKSFILSLRFLLALMVFLIGSVGCVKWVEGDLAQCSSGEQFDSLDRSCMATYSSLAPFGTTIAIALEEDTFKLARLDYQEGSIEGIAVSCEIDTDTLVNVAQVEPCSCAAGRCTVGLVGFPNARRGTILYRFQDRRGTWGDYQSAAVMMESKNDAPTFCPVSLAGEAMDNCENKITGKDWDCIAMGDPNSFTLGSAPHFDFSDVLSEDGLSFYNQADDRCYYSDAASDTWQRQSHYNCVVTKNYGSEDPVNCSSGEDQECRGAGAPVADHNQTRGQVYFATDTHRCYYFNGNSWQDLTEVYEQVVAVEEDTPLNLSNLLQVAYDVEDGQLNFQNNHSFTNLVAAVDRGVLRGGLENCPGSHCVYRPAQNLNVGYDGDTLTNPAQGIDTVTLRAKDSQGLRAESTVAFIVREVNDPPSLPSGRITLAEGESYSGNLTLTHEGGLAGTWGHIVDYDEEVGLKNFIFLSDATDLTGRSECLSGQSIMSDLLDGGGSGSAPFNGAGDNVLFCDTGKGVARARFPTGDHRGDFRETEISFFPNLNFTGEVVVAFALQDSHGSWSNTATLSLTYTPTNDAPTACLYTDRGHRDCGFLGSGGRDHPGVACLWDESPQDLSSVLDTSSRTDSLYPNHGGFPRASDLAGGAIFYHQRNDTCFLSVAAAGDWKTLGVQSCSYSLDAEDEADDCGGGSDCVGANLPSTAPTTTGLVFYDNDDFNCYISEGGAGWNLITGHWVYKVDENATEGSHEVTVDTTGMAKDPDGDDLSYVVRVNPNKGVLTDCPGSSCRYRPNDLESGFDSFTLQVSDGFETEDIVVGIAIRDINTSPVLTYQDGQALHGTRVVASEGGVVQIFDLVVDEGALGTGEDGQSLSFDVASSNPDLLLASAVQVFWGDRSTFTDTLGRSNLHTATDPHSFDALGDDEEDSAASSLGLRFETLPGKKGETTISITIQDSGSPVATTSVEFTLDVRGVGASFQGWDNVFAVGSFLRKSADAKDCDDASERSLSIHCGGGSAIQDCTGALNPNSDLTTYDPAVDGLVFFDSSTQTCFESHSEENFWIPRGCPYSRSQTYCAGGDCVGQGAPSAQEGFPSPPGVDGLFYSDVESGLCYTSVMGQGWVPEGSYVELDWKSLTPWGGAIISGYQVFRRTKDFEYDYSSPIAEIHSATITRHIDPIGLYDISGRVPAEGQVLFYKILPVEGVTGKLVFPQESYSEVAVVLPPFNMVMVPRRIANADICKSLKQVPDRSQNNRCAYTGLVKESATDDYFQLTYDLMMDRFEYGCHYTSALRASGGCGTGALSRDRPCYGTDLPTPSSVANNIFYDRSTGRCHVNNGGSWVEVKDAGSTQMEAVATGGIGRFANLPPLTHVSQQNAQSICAARTTNSELLLLKNDSSDISIGSNSFRLPSRLEQVVLASWDSGRYSDADISVLEEGVDMNTSPKCNSSKAHGVSGFSDADLVLSSVIHTLPGTSSSGILSLATGSDMVSQCSSRYQVRSLVGNVREWSDEQFSCDSTTGCTGGDGSYTGSASGANIIPLAPSYSFDGVTGPEILLGAASWILAEESSGASFFDFPVALPFSLDSTTISFEIGLTSGITAPELHFDTFTVPETTTPDAAILYGGGYKDGTGAGRYYGRLQSADTLDSETGFRCILPIAPNYY